MTNGEKPIDSDYSKNGGKGNVMQCHFWWTWVYLYLLHIWTPERVRRRVIYTARMICVWLMTGKQRQVTLSDGRVLFKLFSRIAFAAFSFKPHYYQLNTPPGCVCERDFLCSWWKLIADIHQLILDPRIEYNDILVIYTSFTKYFIRHGYFWMTVNEQMCFLAVYHLQKLNQTPVSIYESPHLNNCRVK